MDRAGKQDSAERIPEGSEDKADAPRRLARFAQYTSPAMLAMLVSTGKDAAFAGS
jgi:hypothetical protein